MKLASRLAIGLAGGVTAVGLFSASAFGAANTISPISGPTTGNTATTITIPSLANPVVQATATHALAGDGNVYNYQGTKVPAPAGVLFTSIAGETVNGVDYLSAISADGEWYMASIVGGVQGALAKKTIPTTVKEVTALYALGTDGNVYNYQGAKVSAPAGVTFKSIYGENINGNIDYVSAIATDGSWYRSTNDGTTQSPMVQVPVPVGVTEVTAAHALGTDGNVYQATGAKVPAPNGVTFTALAGETVGTQNYVSAISTDGSWYLGSRNSGVQGALAKKALPTTVAAVDTLYALGADGNVYNYAGAVVSAPAGVKFTAIGGENVNGNIDFVSGISTDGSWYRASNTGGAQTGFSHLTLPLSPLTVTGVTFGGAAATAVSQPTSTTVASTTPAHAAGKVDVVVTTQQANGLAGPTFTLPQSFEYIDVASSDVTFTGPADSSLVNVGPIVFSGQGAPGAAITVTDPSGTTLCTTTVDANGDWACENGVNLPDGPITVTATQDWNGQTSTADTTFTIADSAGTPLIAPLVAGGVLMLGAAVTGTWVLIRRRKAPAEI